MVEVPLAINVSLPSDRQQGRSRLEKPLHKWLDGSDEAGRARAQVCAVGPRRRGQTMALKFAVPVPAQRGTPAPATVRPWGRWPGSR
jgi:hypothetical protein